MRRLAPWLLLFACLNVAAQQRGDWVLAQWQGGEYWFPGVIEKVNGNKITIVYDDGTRETRPYNQVRPYDWRVGTRVHCQWAGGTDWYAGRITRMHRDGVTLDIEYDDGDRERTRTGSCRSY
ncbi:MAG: hypothetical protein KDI37_12250 [Xanthomonadales bacterium]|nr:hypothetical protein [Xanthomonadales bacterium]